MCHEGRSPGVARAAFRRREPSSRYFIERRQHAVIERILRHCGLWEGPIRTLSSPRAPPRDPDAASELKLVPDAAFLESERLEAGLVGRSAQPYELQLVLEEQIFVAFLPAGAQCKDDARVDRYLSPANSFLMDNRAEPRLKSALRAIKIPIIHSELSPSHF
jgi:hypothetical protein